MPTTVNIAPNFFARMQTNLQYISVPVTEMSLCQQSHITHYPKSERPKGMMTFTFAHESAAWADSSRRGRTRLSCPGPLSVGAESSNPLI